MKFRKYLLCFMIYMLSYSFGYKYERWMEESRSALSEKTLFDIMLPGTHDSGTYSLGDNICPGGGGGKTNEILKVTNALLMPAQKIMKRWSITQNGNITSQLNAGMRYFDIRALWDKNQWFIHHALEGEYIHSVFHQIKAFLEKHKYEVIWIDISHTEFSADGYNNTELLYLITDIVGYYAIPTEIEIRELKFKTMWKNDVRLLLTFDLFEETLENNKFFYVNDLVEGVFANTPYTEEMILHNSNLLDDRTDGLIMQISWTITPGIEAVLCSALPGRPQSLLEFAVYANNEFVNWFSLKKKLLKGSIVMVDNYEQVESLVVSAILVSRT